MDRTKILEALKQYKKTSQEKYEIVKIGLFGSLARGEAGTHSDVDIVIILKKQDLFNIIGIKQELEEELHASVDVISYRETMNPFLKQRIDEEAVYV